jgi:hypothetical protein
VPVIIVRVAPLVFEDPDIHVIGAGTQIEATERKAYPSAGFETVG